MRSSSSPLLNPHEPIGGYHTCTHSQSVLARLLCAYSTRAHPPRSDSPNVCRLDLGARIQTLPSPRCAHRLFLQALQSSASGTPILALSRLPLMLAGQAVKPFGFFALIRCLLQVHTHPILVSFRPRPRLLSSTCHLGPATLHGINADYPGVTEGVVAALQHLFIPPLDAV